MHFWFCLYVTLLRTIVNCLLADVYPDKDLHQRQGSWRKMPSKPTETHNYPADVKTPTPLSLGLPQDLVGQVLAVLFGELLRAPGDDILSLAP